MHRHLRVCLRVLTLLACAAVVAASTPAPPAPPAARVDNGASATPQPDWDWTPISVRLDELARFYAHAAALPPPPTARPPTTSPPSTSAGTISSTAYCLTGTMANGEPAHYGAVAANAWPLGTRLRVTPSPVGEIVVVADRIGHGSQLDFAMPGDCAGARAWGRRAVTVEVV